MCSPQCPKTFRTFRVGVMLGCTLQIGCATSGRSAPMEVVIVENVSADAIRVSIDFGDRELRLGRLMPMTRRELKIRNALPPGNSTGRIRVVPIGVPDAQMKTRERTRAGAIFSDAYTRDLLVGSVWRYSGSQVTWLSAHRE